VPALPRVGRAAQLADELRVSRPVLVRRDERPEDCEPDEQDDDDPAQDRQAVLEQALERIAPQACRGPFGDLPLEGG
jgi:hypothetical protein